MSGVMSGRRRLDAKGALEVEGGVQGHRSERAPPPHAFLHRILPFPQHPQTSSQPTAQLGLTRLMVSYNVFYRENAVLCFPGFSNSLCFDFRNNF